MTPAVEIGKSNEACVDKMPNTIIPSSEEAIGNPQKLPKVDISFDKISCNEIADYILNQQQFIFFEGFLYCYRVPVYQRLNDHNAITRIRTLLPDRLAKKLTTNQLNEVLKLIKTTPEIQKSRDEIKTNEHLVCLKNAVYDLRKEILKSHSHKGLFFSFVDASYDPYNIQSKNHFEMYLDQISDGDKHLKELIMQVIGYILSNSMAAKALFILVGVANSGKSLFGSLLEALLGKENCSHVPLQDIPKRFQVAELCGKKLNLCMDLSHVPIKDTGLVKLLTGGDMVPAEIKYQNPFSFKNEAKLLFGCNTLPRIQSSENTRAFINRLVLIPFRYSVPPEEQDKDLLAKLLKERNYIVHKAIQALKHLIQNNYNFPNCKASESLKADYVIKSNNILEFVSEKCNIGHESLRVYSLTLYDKYQAYRNDRGYNRNEIFNFTDFRNILLHHFDIESTRWRNAGENRNGFVGISLKD